MAENNTGGQERSEQPTPRRLQKARDEGKVARSAEMAGAIGLLAAAVALGWAGSTNVVRYSGRLLHDSACLLDASLGIDGATQFLADAAKGLIMALLPFLLIVGGAVLLVNLAQARGILTTQPIMPKLSHLSPIAGFKRIFSGQALFTLGKSTVKLVVLVAIGILVIQRSWPEIVALPQAGAPQVGAVVRIVLLRMAFWVGLSFLIVSLVDYAYQVWRHQKSLRMTRQEVVYENRETEGDPIVKSRLRSMGRSLARSRMLQKVPEADVVVVNPTRIAVALRYDTKIAAAPLVLAMGQRKLAERIRAIASRASVPVVENRAVARALLATAKVGRPIPPALYAAVAEILAFVYRQRRDLAARNGLPDRSAA